MPRPPPYPGAEPFLPALKASLPQLTSAAQSCRGCDLYKRGTQAVMGEGPTVRSRSATPRIMLIGEQPGDQEDLQGHPFVGPAGAMLDKALAEAGMDRTTVFVTNAVKHFKWTPSPRGKRRLHAKPSPAQVRACRPWLGRELALVKPAVIVVMGATAALSLLGSAFRVTKQRGRVIRDAAFLDPESLGFDAGASPALIATIHPSSILRAPTSEDREAQYRMLVDDLKLARAAAP